MKYEIYNVDTKEAVAEAERWDVAMIIVSALRANNRETDFRACEKQVS